MPYQHVDPSSAAYLEEIADCNWNDATAISDLITSRHTPVAFREDLLIEQFTSDTVSNFFMGFFGSEKFNWGEGFSRKTETYHQPVLPIALHRWILKRPMAGGLDDAGNSYSDPTDLEDCVKCREDLPTGGYSTQDIEFYEASFKTKPYCISKIRGKRDWMKWSNMIIEDQKNFEDQIMTEFFIMCAMRWAGNKLLLESSHPEAGASARDLLDDYPMAYRSAQFPAVYDADNIKPFDLSTAEDLAYQMVERSMTSGAVAEAPDGSPVFEFWTSSDWRRTNIIQDPDFADKFKYTMPAKLFPGYSLNEGTREVIGNLAPRIQRTLPRLADSNSGGITIVQPFTQLDVEIGTEPVKNPNHRKAPYEVVLMVSPNMGSILVPEPITVSQGIAITPIYGNRGWVPWNEFDKECNPEKNMPYWKFDADFGFSPRRPDESVAIISRRQVFRRRPQNECNYMPRLCVDPTTFDCTPSGSNERISQSLTAEAGNAERIITTSTLCGDGNRAWVKVTHKDKRANFLIDIDCGDTARAVQDDGSEIEVKIVDTAMAHPHNLYQVERVDAAGDPLAFDGDRSIVELIAYDADPATGLVLGFRDVNNLDCGDFEAGEVEVILDSALNCGATAAVTVVYKNTSGVTTTTDATATIATADPSDRRYLITLTNAGDSGTDDGAGDGSGTVYSVTCN